MQVIALTKPEHDKRTAFKSPIIKYTTCQEGNK
jgi:hypothetical protein